MTRVLSVGDPTSQEVEEVNGGRVPWSRLSIRPSGITV